MRFEMVDLARPIRWCVLVSLALLVNGTLAACRGGEPTATEPAPTAAVVTEIPPTPTEEAATLESTAEKIAEGVGEVRKTAGTEPTAAVFIFEEQHTARAAQVEIAIMINRLYEAHGLRVIGLEGAMRDDGRLECGWLGATPPFKAYDPVTDREDTIVQWLEEGEVTAAETLAMVYEDMVVAGTEVESEYAVETSDEASGAPIAYLIAIALPGLTQAEQRQVQTLLEEKKQEEAFDVIVGSDPFTKRIYDLLTSTGTGSTVQAEELVTALKELDAKATEVGAEIEPADRAGLQEMTEFFATAVQRSATMVDSVTAVRDEHPGQPVAMIIGAAHTDGVAKLLAERDVPYAVFRASSFDGGELSDEAYDRKLEALSVNPDTGLGGMLDGRRKPPPVIETLWFEAKGAIYLAAVEAAAAVADGKTIEDLSAIKVRSDKVTFTPLEIVDDEVIFSVTTVDNNNSPVTLYGRAAKSVRESRQLAESFAEASFIEQRLGQAREYVLESETTLTERDELVRLDAETLATFSDELDTVKDIEITINV